MKQGSPEALHRVCLVAGGSAKVSHAAPARVLYKGEPFRLGLAWAFRQGFHQVAVMSAKHFVVDLDQVLQPYGGGLAELSSGERRQWADRAFTAIDARWHLRSTRLELTLLAGARLTEELALRVRVVAPHTVVRLPLAGLGLGQQKAWLRQQLEPQEREAAPLDRDKRAAHTKGGVGTIAAAALSPCPNLKE